MIFLKIETRSNAKLTGLDSVGAWNYSLDPSTMVSCLSWCWNNETASIDDIECLQDNVLKDILITTNETLACPNSFFSYAIYRNVLEKNYNFPPLNYDRFHCLQSSINDNNLPRSINQIQKYFNIDSDITQKEKQTHLQLMQSNYFPTEVEFLLLKNYCEKSAGLLSRINDKLYLNDSSQWRTPILDLKINVTGLHVDVDHIKSALKLYKALVIEKKEEAKTLTNNELQNVTSKKELLKWLKQYNIYIPEFSKDYIENFISNSRLTPLVEKILKLRVELGSNSVAKYIKMLKLVNPDNRIRGLLTYSGTISGRWSSYDVQLQNMPRCDNYNADKLSHDIKNCSIEEFKAKYTNPLDALKCSIRGSICAPEGKVLVGGDYSSIEFRVLMWLCSDVEMLNKLRNGDDIYLEMARTIFNGLGVEKLENWHKKIGKKVTLSVGYGLTAHGLLKQLQDIKEFKDSFLKNKSSISAMQFCEFLIKEYFKKMAYVKDLWVLLYNSAIVAFTNNSQIKCSRLTMWRFRSNLHVKLPSGREIIYNDVEIDERNKKITYYFNGNREELTGKILCAHVCQGVARDRLVNALLNLDKNNFNIILTVHDEIICEESYKRKNELKILMEQAPRWCLDLPTAVTVWENERYIK